MYLCVTLSGNSHTYIISSSIVAYEHNENGNKPARNHPEKGCAIISWPILQRSQRHCKTAKVGRSARDAMQKLFTNMQQSNHKLHHLVPRPGNLIRPCAIRNARVYSVRRCRTDRINKSCVSHGLYNWQCLGIAHHIRTLRAILTVHLYS